MRKLVSAMLGAAVALGSGSAMAQEFGAKGTPAFGADRLFGLNLHHESREDGAGLDHSTDTTDFGIVWRSPVDYAEVPRLAFDYFVIDGLSIGGSIGYASVGGDADGSAFLLAPRVGYVWMFNDSIGFWLRGGLTYANQTRGNAPNDNHENVFALTAEGMFVFAVADHFGFEVGPTLDLTLTGSYHGGNNPDRSVNYRDIGVFNAGLVGWL